MHKALENFYEEYKKNNVLPEKSFLTNEFQKAFERDLIYVSDKEKLLSNGIKGLEGYYDNVIMKRHDEILFTELNFDKRNVTFDDIKITGKIDAIIAGPENTTQVIDYKTGRIKYRGEIEKFIPNASNELVPSHYYSQLMFYKILTDNDKSWKKPVSHGILDFIEGKDGKYKQEQFEYKQEDLDVFKNVIKDTVKRIRNLEFQKIKKGKTCEGCDFRKICWGG